MLLFKLQRVLNASARPNLRVKKRNSTRFQLRSLNWLRVKDLITFRIATLTYRYLHCSTPFYLSRLITAGHISVSLRSSSSNFLLISCTCLVKLGDRSFSKVAPSIWNSLPLVVCNAATLSMFLFF